MLEVSIQTSTPFVPAGIDIDVVATVKLFDEDAAGCCCHLFSPFFFSRRQWNVSRSRWINDRTDFLFKLLFLNESGHSGPIMIIKLLLTNMTVKIWSWFLDKYSFRFHMNQREIYMYEESSWLRECNQQQTRSITRSTSVIEMHLTLSESA